MAADSSPSKPPGFATLAKRITSWTTNSLLTLLVLVVGLGFGRQVLEWWRADASPPGGAGSLDDGFGDPSRLHTVQFGDSSWSLRRQSIVGDKQSAVEQLRAACCEAIKNHLPIAQNTPPTLQKEPGVRAENEDKFLALLSESKPVEEEPGKWRVYEFHEAFPMAVGVARLGAAAANQPAETGSNLAQSGYRVINWAVAVPVGNREWTVCSFQPESPSAEVCSGLADIPFPEGCHRSLSLQAAGGAALVAFSGPDHPDQWKLFYTIWFRRQGWQTVTVWQPVGAAWYAKFEAKDGGGSVDVRFGPDDRGDLSGLLMITPPGAR